MRYLIGKLGAWLRYRSEKRWLDRDPYGYIRYTMGLPADMTDEEIDARFVELGRGISATAVSADEAVEGLRAFAQAVSAVDEARP